MYCLTRVQLVQWNRTARLSRNSWAGLFSHNFCHPWTDSIPLPVNPVGLLSHGALVSLLGPGRRRCHDGPMEIKLHVQAPLNPKKDLTYEKCLPSICLYIQLGYHPRFHKNNIRGSLSFAFSHASGSLTSIPLLSFLIGNSSAHLEWVFLCVA